MAKATLNNELAFLDANGRFVADEQRIRDCGSPNIGLARRLGREWKAKLRLPPVRKISKETGGRLALLIDMQSDFADDGRLGVPGTYLDVTRLLTRLWRGFVEEFQVGYTDWIDTNDFHPEHVIHGDSWWEDEKGNWPDVENCICMEMELVDPSDDFPFAGKVMGNVVGRFRPRVEFDWTVNQYAPHLKATGQGNIWVFKAHCRMGTDGVQTIPALAEFREFVACARDFQPLRMFKGQIAKVDWFGPFHPCMEVTDHPQGGWQKEYLERIRSNAVTEFAGEADDFCVRAGTGQTLEYYSGAPDVLRKVKFLKDCTSAIFPDDPSQGKTGNADHRKLMESKGVQMITHDAPFTAA